MLVRNTNRMPCEQVPAKAALLDIPQHECHNDGLDKGQDGHSQCHPLDNSDGRGEPSSVDP
ncbi:hypothetical protein P7K49_025966, partial [Saguinus oedipus]